MANTDQSNEERPDGTDSDTVSGDLEPATTSTAGDRASHANESSHSLEDEKEGEYSNASEYPYEGHAIPHLRVQFHLITLMK